MANTATTIFISDLHLQENCPKITQLFLSFLQSLDPHDVEGLYILGDLFEVWVGDDAINSFHEKIIKALNATSKRIPIYFLYGNRDFLIGKRFLKESGCQLLSDESIITLFDQPILLMHGDTLCTRDLAYMKARKKMRNKLLKKLFLLLPLNLRNKIADNLREKSKQHTTIADAEIMDVTQSEVEKKMQQYQAKYLIHGHTHKPGIHDSRIVLGAWHNKGNMLVFSKNSIKIIEFGDDNNEYGNRKIISSNKR